MKIISIRERPEYAKPILENMGTYWSSCTPWTQRHINETLTTAGPLPETYVAVEEGEVLGLYTLAVKEVICKKEKGLWMATLYLDPKHRGRHLSPILIRHAQRRAAELGYSELYLTTYHINYYEKFGFYEIGPSLCDWDEPFKLYESHTIPEGEKLIA